MLANDCPTKLFYAGKSDYANQSIEDSFLLALADGGFQVGALAKCYFPGGHDINMLDYEKSLAATARLLQQDSATIYEAAIATDKLFIRVDILVKNGSQLKLYEVKAKSFDPTADNPFITQKNTIKSEWRSYLDDVAFQKYVIHQALPHYEVSAHLMLADKSATCPTDGLNQKFQIVTRNGRRSVQASDRLTEADLTPPILCKVNVDAVCDLIYAEVYDEPDLPPTFTQRVEHFAAHYAADRKIDTPVSITCHGCEFHTTVADEQAGLKSGRAECWKGRLGWNDADFAAPTVLNVWNFRKKTKLIEAGRIRMVDLMEDDVAPKPDKKPGISVSQRQWLQIEKYQTGDDSAWLDRKHLQSEMNSWQFPLHFIDFETLMAAIPFNAGRRPYEGIAFQFSHHIVQEDGTVAHAGEYLNTERGAFPNYDFLRALKSQLENDQGSIFRYASHENSFLNMIFRQLQADPRKIADRTALCDFIRSITTATNDSAEQWQGERNMVDMLEMVKRYYYDPATNGSNSIKQVLPAILNSSTFLQNKYSRPIYGSPDGIRSLNFKNWAWIKFDGAGAAAVGGARVDGTRVDGARVDGARVVDPYKRLPAMFQDISGKDMRRLSEDAELRDGGAAMTAYARMQFAEMSAYEHGEIRKALLKYCELDTMAMVMIYEGWRDFLQRE